MILTQDHANGVLVDLGVLLENLSLNILFINYLSTKFRIPISGSSAVITVDNKSQYECISCLSFLALRLRRQNNFHKMCKSCFIP
jgi:hypothetical protein